MSLWFRRVQLIAIVVGSSLALSGCFGSPLVSDGGKAKSQSLEGSRQSGALAFAADWAERAVVSGPDHDHAKVEHHQDLSTPNFEVIGYNPLKSDWYGKPPGGFGCSKTASDGKRRLSVTSSFNTDAGLLISDVTDPRKPEKIGELVLPWTNVYDNLITPDLRWVLLATSPLESGPEDVTKPPIAMPRSDDVQPYFRDACTGETRPVDGPEQSLPYSAGLILIDIENPRVPRIVDFLMFPPLGVHSIQAYVVDGQLLLIGSVFSLSGAGGYVVLLNIMVTPTGGKLVPISVIYPPSHYAEGVQRMQDWSVHDAYIQRHPVTKELLVYIADIYHGVWIVNIDNLRMPQYIYHWEAKPHFGRDLLVHGVTLTPELWDGRHYTFVGEECYGHFQVTPTCLIVTLDTTDPRHPRTISAWTTPVDLEWKATLQWSLHYAGLLNRTLLVTGYHAGIWAIDVSTPDALLRMPTIGAFVPNHEMPQPIRGGTNSFWNQDIFRYSPIVWEFDTLEDGTIITYDLNTGLYAVRFDAGHPAPSPPPWPTDRFKFDAPADRNG